MAERPTMERRSALAASARALQAPGKAGVRLAEIAHTGKIILRGEANDAAFMAAAETALGMMPPVQPCTSAVAGELSVLWLGPSEWLVTAPPGREAALAPGLRAALTGTHHAVVDVSESMTIIRVAGPRSRDALAKGCPLDFHPRAFAPGACAQSVLANASIILHGIDAEGTLELYVARSYAEYLWAWLEDAAFEYRS